MTISESTRKYMDELKKFSNNRIKNFEDVSFLIEISSPLKTHKLFNDTIFTAKYLNGLGKILRDHMTASLPKNGNTAPASIDQDAMEKVRDEFREHMRKFSLQLTTLIKDSDDTERKTFEEKYLVMKQQSMVNLTSLIYDLSWVKKFRNSKV